jgi:UDP-3-O-[3-hydroxymyristoyl] N-acetylglucosamine deacetylase/3-hydroxyacyl-[acyl-carrier-protein] dehydratase
MKQRTIKSTITLNGIGLHTGESVNITLVPAPENHGIKFQRIDLEGEPKVDADVNYVVNTNRSTTLQKGEAKVVTVEHLLSACVGMEIDNLLVKVDGPEMPILDGSAKYYVEAFQKTGYEEQDADVNFFEIDETISYKDPDTGSELVGLVSDNFQITSLIDFDSPVLNKQYAKLQNMEHYADQIAPARTFVFVRELAQLIDQNLIKGGDLDNAVVIADKPVGPEELENLKVKLNKPDIKIETEGYLNTTKLHYSNEPARHKLLDVLGDLSLAGCRIKGKILATKPGHKINVEFAKIIKQKYREHKKLKGKPKYDPTKEVVMDVNQIKEMLPHRYPFLLVDKIIELSDKHVVGVKNITANEQFFQGHFPGNPIFPGVLQMEALAQTGGILALSLQEDKTGWDTYFLKMDHVKFKNKVVPGDTLILKMELISPIRRGLVQMQGTAYVGNRIVSEGELVAQIVKRK